MNDPRPLEGIRILDLSRLLPGPMCSWYLQGLGAEVVRLEDPRVGDYLRLVPPMMSDGTGAWFHSVNAGKRSIAVDLKTDGGVDTVRALLPDFDVLLEGFRPGVLARLGLDPNVLLADFPSLVVASLSGYGQDGPMRTMPGHDLGYAGLAGALSSHRRHDGVPDLPGLQYADMAGGSLTCALQIVAALFHRQRSGRGRWVDASMTDGMLALMAPLIAGVAVGGTRPSPGGEGLTGSMANYNIYRCEDGGLIVLAALEPKFWAKVCAAVGEELPMEISRLKKLFMTRPRDEWVMLLGEGCVTPLLEIDEVIDHPLHRARNMIVGEGENARVRPPFPGSEVDAQKPAPRCGEHTDEELGRLKRPKGET